MVKSVISGVRIKKMILTYYFVLRKKIKENKRKESLQYIGRLSF